MTKLVVCLLFFGLFTIQTVGHMNSDPAPGRSPGPPSPSLLPAPLLYLDADSIVKRDVRGSNGASGISDSSISTVLTTTTKGFTNTNKYNHNENNNNNNNQDDNNNEDGVIIETHTEEDIGELIDSSSINYELNEHKNDNNDALYHQRLQRKHSDARAAAATTTTSRATILTSSVGSASNRNSPGAAITAAAVQTHDKLHIAPATTTTTASAAAATKTTNSIDGDFKSCRERFSEFLNDVVVIDEQEQTGDDVTSNSNENANDTRQQQQRHHHHEHHLHIQLQLEHDIFDTTAMGINCGLMYKVRLTTSPTRTTTTPPSSMSSARTQSEAPTPLSASFDSDYTGEFFVETLSTLNGRERGSFVDHSLGNKLPISWFNALHRNGKDANAAAASLNWLSTTNGGSESASKDSDAEKNDFNSATSSDEDNFAAHNDDYDTVDNLQHQQQQQQRETFNRKWLHGGGGGDSGGDTLRKYPPPNARKPNGRKNAKLCPDNKWRGSTKSHDGVDDVTPRTDSLSLWMLNELCEQEDTIEFRVFFRVTFSNISSASNMENSNNSRSSNSNNNSNYNNNDANVEAQYVVFKKTFKFQIRKDCQLLLREQTAGILDYTTLPLYNFDCTVHFPSYDHLGTTNPLTMETTPPAGILVELQRLNVPCSSGGYVSFNERNRNLCGKLEELNDSDRAYHFDVRQHTSVRFFKNPMFSLSYKLVDYCYNVSTSNQTGEYYVRPSMRDSLECYFRIHLPYGNRVVLRLVTNNDSDILYTTESTATSGGNGAFSGSGILEEEDALTIYTSLGMAIETQIINLTLSGSSYVTSMRTRGGATGAAGSLSSDKRSNADTPMNRTVGSAGSRQAAADTANIIGLDSFAFLTDHNANLFNAALGTANCDGIVIKVFENDFSKWSHCVNSTQRIRGFILESSSNTLSIHLFRSSRSNSPLRFDYNAARSALNAGSTGGVRDGVAEESSSLPAIYLSYQARPIPEIVSNCAFGWIAMQQFCVSAIELSMSWHDAEEYCVSLGGHLSSVRNDMHQQTINELLLRSPGYQDQNAYWVGGSDNSYEGDYRWSDGLLFQYTNWFPGWSQHGHYNKQPNDDGLSSQDCIELRRLFRTPPGIQTNRSPLTTTFMWNDRDCNAKNFLICERAMSDESFRRSWINDCNKTVSLTKEHPRASIWSPSFPRQYPDNANCYTTITAPSGYRIVIEFEELVIENEPGCTYDYLEITEPIHIDTFKSTKSSKHKNANSNINTNNNKMNNNNDNNNNNSNSNFNTNANTLNTNKSFRKRSSYENPSLSSYMSTPTSTTTSNSNTNSNSNINNNNNNNNNNANTNSNINSNTNNNVNNDNYLYSNSYNTNYNLAQTNYQKLLHILSALYKPHANFLIQTPDYPKGNPYSSPHPTHHNNNNNKNNMRDDDMLPKRLCGDWSSKLKLLRHISSGSYLGLHFVSDYSHHFGGYKAKTYMENTASECANERLKLYNGSCYLFISYPEVDWWTAQQICRGMGSKLSSVSSSEEHRFITSNIRNQIDYSPQLIYWLGAELEKNGQFEWTDDSKMSFQGWLPGQGQFDVMPSDSTCLGLQWKMSPTPMLPSGLYWQSQKCNKVGGYVCKKPKESFGEFAFNNFTVTGTEGRLVSPAYPNTYPLNVDYWIHIKSPERTRIIVQFQKIDLEPQDECLYDFVSIQNYELISKITLEPGTNPMPLAMLTSEELMTQDDDDDNELLNYGKNRLHRRIRRNISKKKYTSANTARIRRRKRNTENEFNLMTTTESEIQITSNTNKVAVAANPRRKRSKNIVSKSRKSKNASSNNNMKDATATNVGNPKHRRRKTSTISTASTSFSTFTSTTIHTEMENKLRKYLSGNEMKMNKIKHNSLLEMYGSSQRRQWREQHKQQHKQHNHHQRKRRSTIMSDDTLSAPSGDNAQSFLPYVRWCGSHNSNMSKFDFVSSSNQVVLNFHSDYSVTGLGFAAIWKAIDVSGCPLQTLTSRQGSIFSPNYPHFLLNNLNCGYVIQAPAGRRVWLEFNAFDLVSDAMLEMDIGNGLFRPFRIQEHLNEGIFVSIREQLRVQFRTGQHPRGKGFQAAYHTVGQLERRERVISLSDNATGYLFQLNYPHDMPENVDFTQHLVAPFGDNILLELHGVEFSENGCPDNNILEIYDNYADSNGTKWQLCKFQNAADLRTGGTLIDGGNKFGSTELNPYSYQQHQQQQHQRYQQPSSSSSLYNRLSFSSATTLSAALSSGAGGGGRLHQQFVAPPVYITSYLNTLHIRQRTTAKSDANLNATIRIQWDNNYKMKLASGDKTVESCQPNPCQFNGKCVVNNGTNYCQCQGHYTGRFCGLNLCELEPCIFGKCELTATSFKCQCQPGYMGTTCEQKQRPCADNPCEGRGICFEKNGGFFCRCHAWWEGHRCERRMLHIPYKPLSERMLQEPFWLGLITVFVVLAVIGLVWCAKRHFPEKIEKLLAEEADRNRPPGSIHGHHHHTSLREQLQFTTAIPQTTGNIAPGAQRSIFNRLGIRKPSLLSLSSPNPITGGGGAAARTFSLDDLLRPPPRRSPSPRKKRNNSTPVKKNAAEKKQILQQLVSPAANPEKPKVTLGELITMTENRLRVSNVESESDLKETTFSENSGSLTSATVARTIADPKLEKKVTFARLLNKVSAEMSSGSDVDIGQMAVTRNSSALSLPTDIQFHGASSMPPSPCTNDIRSPHSTSSNQGSDSLSSSDLALTDFGLRSMQTSGSDIASCTNRHHLMGSGIPLGMTTRCRLGSAARPKVSSADSILAMFRNFASTATPTTTVVASTVANNSMLSSASVFVSPSTTPTASSPQDDAPGDDESSTSSMHTPVSFSSGAPDSPVFYRQTTIEVPVLDALNAHKSSSQSSSTSSGSANLLHPPTILLEIPSNGINNKCLSPIREMPTPIPSPALTPIMPRPQRSNSPIFQEDPLSGGDFSDDDDKSIRSDCSDGQLSEKLILSLQKEKYRIIDSDVETTHTDTTTTSMANINKSQQSFNKSVPLLRISPASTTTSSPSTNNNQLALPTPMITIDVEPPTPEERTPRPRDLIIPTLTVEQPSPTKNRHPLIIFPGSPPPQRASIGETSFMFPNKQQQKRLLKQFEKPNSLDFPFAPPMITITSNMSELESDDTEPLSPATKTGTVGGLVPPNPVGMCYLSPFTMCSRADRTISESNLSSSGYSSMASPGPSRCGSSNPLCPNEMDEPGSGHSGAGLSLHVNLMNRRRSSALPSCKENISNGKGSGTESGASGSNTDQLHHGIHNRHRSDSETFSDDILLESNDEGIGTDHVDEKLDDANRLGNNRFKELDVFTEEHVLIEVEEPPLLPIINTTTNTTTTNISGTNQNQMAQLQLPSIVIQIDGNEKGISPVSSRSESPLSERAGIGRFSPHFYGRKDQLPFTDSDGLYDFPSSDGKGTSAHSYTHQRRSSSKKRERKSSKCSATQSPTKQQLDVPSKESLNTSTSPSSSIHVCNKHCHSHHHPCPAATTTTRKSPKRRLNNRLPVASSSSSSESLVSAKELTMRQLPRRLNSPNREKRPRKQESLSEDEVADNLLRRISPSIVKEDESTKPKCKINRLRAIGNQIRFLRRLKKSIKTRERLASPSDSCPEENTDDMDSPQATSPLLQPQSPNKTRIALCRQKRLPSGTYGITAAALNSSNWKGMDRSLIGDDLNSD